MKRFFLFIVGAMLLSSAAAQPKMPGFHFGMASKGYDYMMSHNSHIIAEQDGELIIATWETRGILGACIPWGLQVVAVDTNMKVLRQVALPDSRMDELVFANYVDGKVYLIIRHPILAQYRRVVVDPRSMTVESCEMMSTKMSGKNIEAYHWDAKSDNGLFYALVDVSVNTVSKEMAQRQLLLDEKMEVLWEKRFEASEVSDIRVSDDGEMYLFGSRYDKGSRETIVALHVLDVDDEKSAVGRVATGEVYRLALLNVVDGKAVAAGYIRTPESPKNKDCFDQMVGMSLDIRSGELKTQTVRFSSDELNVFGNKSTKKENKVGMVDALTIANTAATNYGGVLLLQRCWKVTTHSTKTPDVHDYYTMGSLLLAVDTTGTILWRRPFRTVNGERTGQSADIPCYGDAPMMVENDNVYVILPEPTKTPETYEFATPVTKIVLGNRAHANVVYGIDRQGTVVKQVPVPKDKGSMMDNMVRQAPGKYVGIYSFHKKSALVHVSF